jgi:hypothetical protein
MSAEINIYNPEELGPPMGQYTHVTRVKANEFLFVAGIGISWLLSPHSPHPGANIHFRSLAGRACRGAGRHNWPSGPLE